MMNQTVNGDAERDDNTQNVIPLGDVEIRRLGFKVTGLNATFAIAGTVYLGSIALNGVFSLVQAYCEQVLFKVDHGSYIIHVLTKNAQSKKVLLEQVTSKALEKKLEGIFDKKVEVHLVEVGAVIATEEEYAQLKMHMEKKLKKIQFKIDNNCKGTIEDFCCTMPIFQNKSRFLTHEVTPDTEDDIIECLKNNLEFVKPDEESLLQTAHEKNNAKVKQQGFLLQHPDFSKFSETFQSHPGLQEKVIEVIATVEELVKQNYVMIPQVEAEKLLEFNPILFTGNCEMVTRKLAKVAKTFMFEKDFEITNSLLLWMIKLCNNIMDEKRIKRLLLFFFKLIEVFLDFVSKNDQHFLGIDYAWELYDETERCAETNVTGDLLHVMKHYINMVEDYFLRYDFRCWNFWSRSIIVMMVKQTGKYVFKLVHYYLKRLLLMTRNCDFEIRRLIRYDCAIRNLLEVAERLVEVSHNRFVRMLVEVLEIVHSGVNLRNVPDNYYPTFILQTLLHSFNTIHEIFESKKKSQCDSTSSSIFVLLFTIYKLLLLYNDRSARPLPVTELSSCVLRLCYYHPPHNGKLPHELSVAEIFDSGSNLLKQGTEKNKAAKKFRNYRIDSSESDDSEFDESDEFEYDEFHDISDSSTSFDSAFPRRNVDQHLPSLDIAVSSGYGVQKSTGLPVHESGHYKWSSGYGSEQGTVSLLPPPSSLPTQKIKSSFPKRFGAQHQQFP